ncbi:hypothetical protein COO60DRAFT_923871 [Scenedesmus sp. NREL 46B-D3]|nr:hypothetical protein COO60DRAFT_923871 [Scenedesmus sp. NREL 46B-D3]
MEGGMRQQEQEEQEAAAAIHAAGAGAACGQAGAGDPAAACRLGGVCLAAGCNAAGCARPDRRHRCQQWCRCSSAAAAAAAAAGAAATGAARWCGSSSHRAGWSWGDVQQLVVYGLGSPDDSKVSRHQLALVLLLQGLLPGLTQPPQLYDPAFGEADALLLQALGLAVIGANEEGRRGVDGPTLFYLPHCEATLTDNLLCANARADQQCCLALLGNSFATYQSRWAGPAGSRPRTARPDRLLQLIDQGSVVEVRVHDAGYHVASAFNDMSLHTFRAPVDRGHAADHGPAAMSTGQRPGTCSGPATGPEGGDHGGS